MIQQESRKDTSEAEAELFRLGLIINPLAGIGGSVGLKGSDGDEIVALALSRGGVARAEERAERALTLLRSVQHQLKLYCFDGPMGGDLAIRLGFSVVLLGAPQDVQYTSAADTECAARSMAAQGADLVLFAGGDGTARNICTAVGSEQPVLGIPAGVKMHSGVYAITPEAAGEVALHMAVGRAVDVGLAEVRDLDEQAYREGRVNSRYFGEMLVPRLGQFVQAVKSGEQNSAPLTLDAIADEVVETIEPGSLQIVGAGSTTAPILERLGLDNTLLGVDVVLDGEQVGRDVTEADILELLGRHQGPVRLLITPIGGQGHILGRGNQQLSPAVIRRIGRGNILVVATPEKLANLHHRPLLVDSGDLELDQELRGVIRVVTGYREELLYPVRG